MLFACALATSNAAAMLQCCNAAAVIQHGTVLFSYEKKKKLQEPICSVQQGKQGATVADTLIPLEVCGGMRSELRNRRYHRGGTCQTVRTYCTCLVHKFVRAALAEIHEHVVPKRVRHKGGFRRAERVENYENTMRTQ